MRNTKKRHLFRFSVDVYFADIVIAINATTDEICSYLKRQECSAEGIKTARQWLADWDENETTIGMFFKFGGSFGISIRHKPPIDFTETIVHELCHVSQFMLKMRGINYTNSHAGREAQAYLMECLWRKTIQGMAKRK